MFLISRDSIPSIHQVEVDGRIHNLGTLKDLRKNPEFARYIPENARVSISWVHLSPNERLEEHRHPTTSVIIVAEGHGKVSGDISHDISDGDVVVVPPNALHGFIGIEPHGFWALSMQFEGRALYEDLSKPRVLFENPACPEIETKLRTLLSDNEKFITQYRSNPLIALVQGTLITGKDVRTRMLNGLQLWSNCFQKILFTRAAFESEPEFLSLAQLHIAEELGHNKSLEAARGSSDEPMWDPILVATSSWFVEQMQTLSSVDRTIVVHLALEGSGEVFHKAALHAFPNSEHFITHNVADSDHMQMGIDVLKNQTDIDLPRSREILRQAWAMMNFLSERIAELAIQGHER